MNDVLCRFYLYCNAGLASSLQKKIRFLSWGNIKFFNYKPHPYAPLYNVPSLIRGFFISEGSTLIHTHFTHNTDRVYRIRFWFFFLIFVCRIFL